MGGEERPERRSNERRRHPRGRNEVEEPAARRLAAAAAAPSRERRPPALGRGATDNTARVSARPLAPAGTAASQRTGTPSEAGGARCTVGLRRADVPERRQRPERNRGAPADRRAGVPAGPFSSKRRTLSGCASKPAVCVISPARFSRGVAGRPAPQKGYGGTLRARHQGKAFPFMRDRFWAGEARNAALIVLRTPVLLP